MTASEDTLERIKTVKVLGNEPGSPEDFVIWDLRPHILQQALLDKGILEEEDLENALDKIRADILEVIKKQNEEAAAKAAANQ